MSNLQELDLNNNQLTGSINGIEQLTELQFLQLDNNLLSGSIPSEVRDMSNLSKCREATFQTKPWSIHLRINISLSF